MSLRAVLALVSGTLGLVAVEAAASAAWATRATAEWILQLGLALTWSLIGAIASWRRPRSRIGVLMMVVGLVLAAGTTASGLRSSGIAAVILVSVGLCALGVLPAPCLHTVITYPSGRIPDRLTQWSVWIAYCFVGLDSVRLLLTSGYRRSDADRWLGSPLRVVEDPNVGRAVELADVAVGLAIILGFGLLLIRRVRRASDRDRRVLAFPFVAVCFAGVLLVLRVGWLLGDVIWQWKVRSPQSLILVTTAAATVAVPVAFLVGLLRERLAYASVSDLVRAVERLPVDQVEPALARALGDPSLQVLFPVAGGYVDTQGRMQSLPRPATARAVFPLGTVGSPVALLVHDPALCEEPALLEAAGAAARLALDNARLHAEVKAQLAEVRASRARLVEAADTARRHLERDLHDGAQQRLLAVGLALRMLRQQLPNLDTEGQEVLGEAEFELRAALDELRELARGIHPAILTEQGLRAAVDQLALRCPVPVSVTGAPGRLPVPVESTAYFVVNEALANIVKHAHATAADVTLDQADGRLVVTVADDGVGGADPAAGTGLSGLADRVASIDGTLTVSGRAGGGTRVIADVPAG